MDITQKRLDAAILDQKVAGAFTGKTYAFTPVITKDNRFGLGIAVENESGYSPVTARQFTWDERISASEFCDSMNKHIGLDALHAAQIVASTMRKDAPIGT